MTSVNMVVNFMNAFPTLKGNCSSRKCNHVIVWHGMYCCIRYKFGSGHMGVAVTVIFCFDNIRHCAVKLFQLKSHVHVYTCPGVQSFNGFLHHNSVLVCLKG